MVAYGRVAGQSRCARYRACGARTRLQHLADIALLLALACVPSPAVAADAVDITAAVGFTDTFQPGRWTPLNVTVTNRGGDLTGELEVLVTGGDELRDQPFVTTHRRRLDLHRDSRKTLQFTIRPQGPAHPLVIRVRADGREAARAEVDLRARSAAERLVLVLSRDADLNHLNAAGADGLRVLYPHPELLPVHWRGYDAAAAIVVHGVSLERLSASQFDALHKWIAQGGILAVSGGPDYALLRSPRLAALLPGTPSGMTRVDAGELRRTFSLSLDVSRPVHVNRLGEFRGRARLAAGNVPLVVERALGLGRVLYLTFDVAGYPFDRWDGMRDLWLEHLRLPPPGQTSRTAGKPPGESALTHLIHSESTDFPSHATAILFLALYLGVLFAGYRLPAPAARLKGLTPLWTLVAPVVFAFAAWWLFGPTAFPRGATAVTVALIEPLPGSVYARIGLELGLYASRSGAQRLQYRGAEPVLYPPGQAQQGDYVGDWVLGEGPLPYVEPLDRRRYVLHALEGEDVIAFHLDASVREEAAGPRLVLDNASGRPLRDLWLFFGGYAYDLGSVAPGAKLERRLDRREHGVEVGAAPWRHVSRSPAGAWVRLMAPARLVLERRLQALGDARYPGQGDALLIAYTTSPLKPAGASAGWPRREQALVALRLAALPGKAQEDETGNGTQ
jgi:hypothetical protein